MYKSKYFPFLNSVEAGLEAEAVEGSWDVCLGTHKKIFHPTALLLPFRRETTVHRGLNTKDP